MLRKLFTPSLLIAVAAQEGILTHDRPAKTGVLTAPADYVPPKKVAGTVLDSVRAEWPECPAGCEPGWPGDGWCDSECASDDCGNDAGDCEEWCAPDCNPEWLGDGFCDRDCNVAACKFDEGDCTDRTNFSPGVKAENFDYANCQCDHSSLGDGECNDDCNSYECNWDGLDCNHQCTAECAFMWLGDGDCDDACNIAECDYDKGDCNECIAGCVKWQVGNGLCDKKCQIEECDFDMGDCDGICKVFDFSYDDAIFHYPHCRDEWIGDGHCDCLCNNEECSFDGGDCQHQNCDEVLSKMREAIVEGALGSEASEFVLDGQNDPQLPIARALKSSPKGVEALGMLASETERGRVLQSLTPSTQSFRRLRVSGKLNQLSKEAKLLKRELQMRSRHARLSTSASRTEDEL